MALRSGRPADARLRRHRTALRGPVNIALPTAVATCYVAIKHLFPALPANAGVMRPVDVLVPEGSFLAAPFPVPVGGYTETILRMIDVIFAAAAGPRPRARSPTPTARSTRCRLPGGAPTAPPG